MPTVPYARAIPPSLMDRFTQQHRDHIARVEAEKDALAAKVAELEERIAVQAATIRNLTSHDDTICDRAFGTVE